VGMWRYLTYAESLFIEITVLYLSMFLNEWLKISIGSLSKPWL
jgi:hypothetical protein